jgi:4-hydroxybenzoate polyprenyltransferase
MSIAAATDEKDARGNGWLTTASHYMHLIRFSHTLFALPFALLATSWAYIIPLPGTVLETSSSQTYLTFRWQSFVGILLCMITARSFAMAINRLLDHRWDGENPRTASRHLPAQLLTRSGVAWFSCGCAAAFVLSCTLFLPNRLPLVLCIPLLGFLGGYSLAKRFTSLVHFWLGIALMLAPICAWIALRGEAVQMNPTDILPALSLGLVVFLWVSGFDIIYACQDAEFDRRAGLFSVPAWLGVSNALRVAAGCHAGMWCTALLLTFMFPALSLGWFFRAALVVVGILLIYEHSIISDKNLTRMQLAFFQLNSIISVLFLIVGTLDSYWR